MKINENTKISKIIKENKEAIEVIASLNKHFTKLRNPILRKVLASRVTVKEAAKIGKCDVQLMLDKLSEIGFEIEKVQGQSVDQLEDKTAEKLAFIGDKEVVTIDVRPYLERNEDPLLLLQNKLKELNENQLLEVLIDFEPIPLIKLQENKGFSTLTVIDEEGLYHTYFKAGEGATIAEEISSDKPYTEVSTEQFEKLIHDFKGELIELDVRLLEMPGPMITILEAVENLPENAAIKVFHKRIPQHLLPELKPKGLKVYIDYVEEGNVMMFITR